MAGVEAKYRQVVEWVRDNIANGTLKSGDRLMSEMELSEQFGVSRETIRHATGELVNEGLLTRVKGSGTYIGGAAVPALPKREKQPAAGKSGRAERQGHAADGGV